MAHKVMENRFSYGSSHFVLLALLFLCGESFLLPAFRPRAHPEAWTLSVAGVASLDEAVSNLDSAAVSALLLDGEEMDEGLTDRAFWSVVRAVDRAEAADQPLPADVPRMLHHIFDADLRHLQGREQVRTNITCMQPKLEGAAGFGAAIGYIMDDVSHQVSRVWMRNFVFLNSPFFFSVYFFPFFFSGPATEGGTQMRGRYVL